MPLFPPVSTAQITRCRDSPAYISDFSLWLVCLPDHGGLNANSVSARPPENSCSLSYCWFAAMFSFTDITDTESGSTGWTDRLFVQCSGASLAMRKHLAKTLNFHHQGDFSPRMMLELGAGENVGIMKSWESRPLAGRWYFPITIRFLHWFYSFPPRIYDDSGQRRLFSQWSRSFLQINLLSILYQLKVVVFWCFL